MYKFKIKGLKENINILKSYEKKVRPAIATVIEDGIQKIFERSQELVPVASGELKESGRVAQTEKGAKVEYTAPHAHRIEYDPTIRHKNGQAFFVGQPFYESKDETKKELGRAAVAPLKK